MEKLLSARVTKMMDELDKDQVEFAKISGASKSVVNQWVGGQIKSMNAKYAYCIQRKAGYNAEWIQTGDGDPKLESQIGRVSDKRIIRLIQLLVGAEDPDIDRALAITSALLQGSQTGSSGGQKQANDG